jgi:hypothetical protein
MAELPGKAARASLIQETYWGVACADQTGGKRLPELAAALALAVSADMRGMLA